MPPFIYIYVLSQDCPGIYKVYYLSCFQEDVLIFVYLKIPQHCAVYDKHKYVIDLHIWFQDILGRCTFQLTSQENNQKKVNFEKVNNIKRNKGVGPRSNYNPLFTVHSGNCMAYGIASFIYGMPLQKKIKLHQQS